MQQESNVTLEILIHDYLKKRNYTEAATNLKNEANIPDYNPKDCIPLLYEWFNAFNDIYNVRSGRVGCHENIARIENVMLKLENEKRKYKNIDSDKSMPEKTKSVHDMGYSSFNDKYSEYTTPKMSNYESSTSLYEPKIEKRSYSEAFDRRSNFEEKIKSQAMNGNAKQYYGRTEGDSIEEGNLGYPKEGQRYRSQYGASTVARENKHTMGYSNDYLRSGYNDLPRMGYPNEQTRQPYKNDSAKSPYENESVRIQYGNDPSKMHYSNEITRPPYSGDVIKMPYGSETGKMQYGTDAKKMSYKEHANGYKNDYQKMGYGSRKYQQESKLPYDKSYSADDLTNDNIANYNDRFLKDPYKNYECLTKITSLQLHKQRINAICVSNKHNIFITGGHDQVINIVDILTFRVTRIDLDVKIISDIKLNERTNELLVAADSDIYIYKLADLSILRVLREHKCSIKDICIDGEFMYTTDVEGTLKKWKGYDVLESVELHVRRLVIFNGVIVASDRNKVFTYDLDKRAVIDVLYDDCAFIKVYSSRLMLFLKTKVFILDENFESINVIACNEKVQSGCILSDNAVLLGFYQGMTKHINNEMFTVNSEGSVMVLEKYVKDSEIVIGGCYDGSVVVWEHH